MRQQMRSEIIDLTNADLQKLAPLIRDTLSEKYLCVVGSSQSIEAIKIFLLKLSIFKAGSKVKSNIELRRFVRLLFISMLYL